MTIIDRIENDTAVCETDEGFVNIPICDFGYTPGEGDVLLLNPETGKYEKDEQATAARKSAAASRLRGLFGRKRSN